MNNQLLYYDGKRECRLVGGKHKTVVPLLDNSNHEQALEPRRSSPADEADQLLEQAIELQKTRQFEAALELFKQALKIYTELQHQWGVGRALRGLGLTMYTLGDFGQAIEYANRSLAIAQDVNDQRLEGHVLGIL